MTNHVLKHQGKTLIELFKTLKKLQTLNTLFRKNIHSSLANHCSVANLENNCLTVIADSGNWATQLRYQTPDLLENLRKDPLLCGLKSITCKTRPNPQAEKSRPKPPRPMKKIPAPIARGLLADAQHIQDKKLRAILEKISKRN